MRAQLRSELLKLRSTPTTLGLLAGLLCLVLVAVLLHGFALSPRTLGSNGVQLMVFGRGEFLAALFAGLLGVLSITGEIHHGTIRPTFLVSPQRGRVIAAKVWASMLIGAGFGLAASALAAAAATIALHVRGIEVLLDRGDYALLLAGSAAAAALWAAIGVGAGAIVRNQVATLVGISAWMLFVEGLLVGDVAGDVVNVGRFAPGAAAAAITGQDPTKLVAPAVGLVLLGAYAAAVAFAGSLATIRRDVA